MLTSSLDISDLMNAFSRKVTGITEKDQAVLTFVWKENNLRDTSGSDSHCFKPFKRYVPA